MQVVAKRVGLLAVAVGVLAAATGAAPLVLMAGALGVVGLVAFLLALLGVVA